MQICIYEYTHVRLVPHSATSETISRVACISLIKTVLTTLPRDNHPHRTHTPQSAYISRCRSSTSRAPQKPPHIYNHTTNKKSFPLDAPHIAIQSACIAYKYMSVTYYIGLHRPRLRTQFLSKRAAHTHTHTH